MKWDITFLRSKVARRIFMLFVCCALIPTTALAILSFTHVTNQLNEQSRRRLRQATKAVGMSIVERLMFLETEMKMVASNFGGGLGHTIETSPKGFGEQLEQRFRAIAVLSEAHGLVSSFGHVENSRKPTEAELEHMGAGRTVVWSQYSPGLPSRIFMMRFVDPQNPTMGFVLGEINTSYLWGVGRVNTLPPMTELCVMDQSNNVLFSSFPIQAHVGTEVGAKTDSYTFRQFEWKHAGREYVASWWTIFLMIEFFTPKWTVVLTQSKADVLAPMANFKKIFPLVVLVSLCVVLLLSIIQIRRNLVPLEKLKEGTLRVARRDFDTRVTVASGDEFEELAGSFNKMSGQLDRQFKALATIREIDQAILSALDTEKIVDTVLTRMHSVSTCDAVSVSLMDSKETNAARTHVGTGNPGSKKRVEAIELKSEDMRTLYDHPEHLFIEAEKDPPHFLSPLATDGIKSFLVLPVFLKQRLVGIITLGYVDRPTGSPDETMSFLNRIEEDQTQARQLADQVAVALSNAQLIEDLEQLNWGTLTALARAVDAKSPWTAGHSERVTNLALKIGKVLGLAPKELEALHRAGLLHDVGKIGVRADILDKPEKLTDEEYSIIKRHPRTGARILEPISTYADVVPIVLQHHEWFNGQGYPDGLVGEAICLGARILAVADVYDALVSDRPYRAGLDRNDALEFIKQNAVRKFDPKVVEALLAVMAQEEIAPQVHAMYVRPPDTAGIMEQHR